MRGLTWVIAGGAVMLLALGCGTAAKTSSTEPSEAPDAVATAEAEPTSAPSSDAGSNDANTDATVVVDGAGFALGKYKQVGYGLVLNNTSTISDAIDVLVTVNLIDKSGAILKTDNATLNLIPAGDTFYFGGMLGVSKGDKPSKMEAFVDVGSSEDAQYRLPTVTHVRVIKDQYVGVQVRGQVKNDWEDGSLSSSARIGCVLFDASGTVVGGGFGYLMASLPPGRTAAVELVIGPSATPASRVSRAELSIDNAFE